MNRIVEKFATLKRDGKKGFIVYIGAGDPNLARHAQTRARLRQGGRGCSGTRRAVQRPAGRRSGEPACRAARFGIRHHAAETSENGCRHPQAIADSDCPLHLFQPHPPRRPGKIHRRRREGRRGRPAGARFAAGGIGQLRGADEARPASATFISSRRRRRRTAWNSSSSAAADLFITSRAKASPECRRSVASNLASQVAKIRAHTDLPIAVGFGISNPAQAKAVASEADGCVVGSAVVNQIAEARQIEDSGEAGRQICGIAGGRGEINLSHG